MTEREFAIDVVRRLREAGHEALWAGGCVRDELLGLVPKDYDIATNARPEEVRRLFRRTVAVGMTFGVVEVLGPGHRVQVATFRSDAGYSDGRHPDAVVFSSAREDALRRDFTINGMFFDPLKKELIDYVCGRDDLNARVLRAIGDPATRIAEDKLRMLRGVRLAARFELTVEQVTLAAVRAMAPQLGVVSAERIADELRKLLVDRHRARGVSLLLETGLAAACLPEIVPMKGLPQGRPASPVGDLWDHVLRVLDLLETGARGQGSGVRGQDSESDSSALVPDACLLTSVPFPLAFAALLHDIGKPRTVGRTAERYTFHDHEHVGARMAEKICERLKLSNAESDRVVWLVEKHQYLCDARRLRPSKLKQVLIHPGIRELLALHRADALAWGHGTDHVDYCERLLAEWGEADLNPPPLLTGHDLAAMGLEAGPLYKRLLDAVREAQLDGTVTGREQAQELVRRLQADEANL